MPPRARTQDPGTKDLRRSKFLYELDLLEVFNSVLTWKLESCNKSIHRLLDLSMIINHDFKVKHLDNIKNKIDNN